MKILKAGKKRFKELVTIHICKCVCNKCDAEFEAQEGELGDESSGYHSFRCPYCNSYHSDYYIKFDIRTEEVPWSKVKNYDYLRNPYREVEIKEGGAQ